MIISTCSFRNPFGADGDNKKPEQIIMFDDRSTVDIFTDPAKIEAASINDDRLNLTISFAGGCKQHEIKLYGAKHFMESYPLQAGVFLSQNAHQDSCEKHIQKKKIFDITPLKETCLESYSTVDSIMLRLYEPGATVALEPLLAYRF